MQRPDYISHMWLKHTTGFSFVYPPAGEMVSERYLTSPNLWERVVCITLQAQMGEFENVGQLIDVVHIATDMHVAVAAVTVFAHTAPSSVLPQLTSVFEHPDYDVRLESYTAPGLACHPCLVDPLLTLLPTKSGDDRGFIADTIWGLLEEDFEEESKLMGLDESDSLIPVARRIAQDFHDKYGPATAIRHGIPLSLQHIIGTIRKLCDREDHSEMGGEIDELLSIFEAMTGISRAGCSTGSCMPEIERINSVLNSFEERGDIERFEVGQRYFFGHPIP